MLKTNPFSVPLSILDLLVSTSVCVPRHSSRDTIKGGAASVASSSRTRATWTPLTRMSEQLAIPQSKQ